MRARPPACTQSAAVRVSPVALVTVGAGMEQAKTLAVGVTARALVDGQPYQGGPFAQLRTERQVAGRKGRARRWRSRAPAQQPQSVNLGN